MYSSSPDEMRAATMRDDPVVCILGDEQGKGALFKRRRLGLFASRNLLDKRGMGVAFAEDDGFELECS
jgi:hypothetical protein